MSTASNKAGGANPPDPKLSLQTKCLEKMEAILNQAANGIHILFEKELITDSVKGIDNDLDFYDFDKVKIIQDTMTDLIARKTYFEKQAYLQSLSPENLKVTGAGVLAHCRK